MIDSNWKRIAGLSVKSEGEMAAVWLAYDPDGDTVHLYDCCIFRREVLAVIGEGLNARGRWIPIAWEKKQKAVADELLERGCNMLPEPVDETDSVAEITSRDIWERMRTGRFKVDRRMKEWLDEFDEFHSVENRVPTDNYPLQAATRFAVHELPYARRQAKSKGSKQSTTPRIAIV